MTRLTDALLYALFFALPTRVWSHHLVRPWLLPRVGNHAYAGHDFGDGANENPPF